MWKDIAYEEVLVKMVQAFIVAVVVVMCFILLMGIQFSTCNPAILLFGIAIITILFTIAAVV